VSVVLVTGAAGLIGSESVRFFAAQGFDVAGIDNDMRRVFFGDAGSTQTMRRDLERNVPNYSHHDIDIRDSAEIGRVFARYGRDVAAVIHTAAQPSHDWAAREPLTDFTVNANGTLVLLEATRQNAPDAAFIFTSTNKVYGDRPNELPLVELETRWELDSTHACYPHGIDESMSIDASMHSLFGASKAAADLMVQEYGRYFGMKTVCFRGGCLTGPSHAGVELHGFLSYLGRCAVTGDRYTVHGYRGKQVRDNIHSHDLVTMFWHYMANPRPAEVYNAGGGRESNCSMREAIATFEQISGRTMDVVYTENNRKGDHIWYISDIRKFQQHYPDWRAKYSLRRIMEEIIDDMSAKYGRG